ncbi:molybdopterin oxidoreductase [Putridiphycobacter roseus]|uniref:Molybdopterin oxidoreductase n=1 Tax=Putridiphycobacter roseus TaxID=2219161 RepID=A0A2W1N5M4_9FLAO|nr:TAT-variant-translocated molybdopterin oxidoreductase [Putridiphycobacter roseus]PZE18910.1 molybdopterin oxidoreductase [Putridiphycobacter roseus]
MGTNKKYWKGLEEFHETPEFLESSKNEFPEELSVNEFLSNENLEESSTGRRDFLKFLGFSVAAATLAACESPVIKAVPYVVKPEEITPGMPNWYASSYYDGSTFANILVKTREGRPIFIKGNKHLSTYSKTANPRVVASVLSLYNSERLQSPVANDQKVDWTVLDANLKSKLKGIANKSGKIVLLSGTEISPSTNTIIENFKATYGGGDAESEDKQSNVEHVQYDAVSYQGIRKANEASFGKAVIPDYDFSKAKVIVSVAADFLNSWLMSNEYAAQYAAKRNPDGEWMNKHFHFEANMSLTGSNADVRGMVKPSQQGAVLSILHKEIVGAPLTGVDTTVLSEGVLKKVRAAAKALKANSGQSLLVAGATDEAYQTVVNAINAKLNNYKSTINLNNGVNLFNSQDDKMAGLVQDMNAGKVDAIIMWNTNPVYSYADSAAFKAGLEKVGVSVAIAKYADETASLCNYLAAQSHDLEAWNDFSPKTNTYALAQPTIRPLFDTRPAAESLMIWAGMASHAGRDSKNYYDFIQSVWKEYGYKATAGFASFDSWWNDAVHKSVTAVEEIPATAIEFIGNINKAAKSIAAVKGGDWEITLYEKSSIGDGTMANNPWLQEMPDSVSKVTWDNYITMSPDEMEREGYSIHLGQESPSTVAKVTVGDQVFELPVFPQPGQAHGTIGIALGYGRGANGEVIGKSAYQTGQYGKFLPGNNGGKQVIGVNVYPLLNASFSVMGAKIEKTESVYNLACTQTHSTVMGRNSIVRETTLSTYKTKDASAYNHKHVLHTGWNHDEKPISEFNLWDEHPVENVGHRWGMAIDLNSCTGCGTCLIACQSENNVPVVGKDEVRRGREMHWLRLDRYYASDIEPAIGTKGEGFKTEGFDGLQEPADAPSVIHMPMMCHHCNHAPCETVCPVAATTHSNEGLNMMAYNRCIGTRYCGNNCPYKVRRFNWFDYPSYRKFTEVNPAQDDLGRMVLNPDVVVRTRGVMEKCSFCVQEIQTGKLVAKKEDRPVKDGDIMTACADACPADAIHFGDWNDVHSTIRKSTEDVRAYQALEEIGVKPNVWFKVKVRNEDNAELAALQTEHHAGHEDASHDTEAHHGEDAAHTEGAHH